MDGVARWNPLPSVGMEREDIYVYSRWDQQSSPETVYVTNIHFLHLSCEEKDLMDCCQHHQPYPLPSAPCTDEEVDLSIVSITSEVRMEEPLSPHVHPNQIFDDDDDDDEELKQCLFKYMEQPTFDSYVAELFDNVPSEIGFDSLLSPTPRKTRTRSTTPIPLPLDTGTQSSRNQRRNRSPVFESYNATESAPSRTNWRTSCSQPPLPPLETETPSFHNQQHQHHRPPAFESYNPSENIALRANSTFHDFHNNYHHFPQQVVGNGYVRCYPQPTTTSRPSVPKRRAETERFRISPIKRQRIETQARSVPIAKEPSKSKSCAKEPSKSEPCAQEPCEKETSKSKPPAKKPSSKPRFRFRAYQTDQWMDRYMELCRFRSEKGHCLVPHSYPENPNLTRWVKRQRYQYNLMKQGKRSAMTKERIQSLEALNFTWDSQEAQWKEKFNELLEYRKEHGNCNVPEKFEGNPKLAIWVRFQKRQYKLLQDLQPTTMTVDRIKRLEDIGFQWL